MVEILCGGVLCGGVLCGGSFVWWSLMWWDLMWWSLVLWDPMWWRCCVVESCVVGLRRSVCAMLRLVLFSEEPFKSGVGQADRDSGCLQSCYRGIASLAGGGLQTCNVRLFSFVIVPSGGNRNGVNWRLLVKELSPSACDM